MFLDDDCCALFVDTLAELPSRFGVRVHGYALMPNHYHLMLEVPRGNVSEAMKHLGATFTQAYNRERGHDGPLFRGRFRNELVQDDAYWQHLLAYLHLNPVKAHLAKRPEHCEWTSHKAYRDAKLRPSWLSCDELIAQFGSQAALLDYIDGVQIGRQQAPKGFDPDRFWSASNTVSAPSVTPAEPARRSKPSQTSRRPSTSRSTSSSSESVAERPISAPGWPRGGFSSPPRRPRPTSPVASRSPAHA